MHSNVKGQTGKFFPREMMWDTKAELDALLTDPKYNQQETMDTQQMQCTDTTHPLMHGPLVRQATNPN